MEGYRMRVNNFDNNNKSDYRSSACVNCELEDFQAMSDRGMDMNREADRVLTYNNWMYSHIQRPDSLAKAGLYFTGIDDRVQCPFCYGVLKKWQRSDIPYSEHSKHFSYCRFIRGYEVGNIPVESASPPTSNYNNYTVYNNINNANNNPDFHNGHNITTPSPLNIMPQSSPQSIPADLQEYLKTEFNRLKTFSKWPPNLIQTPEILSEAGFYHLPTEEKPDRVKCAYCRGKLYNWQEDDEPWIEHARCFPSCPYVELCMSKEVVRELCENGRSVVPVENGYGPGEVPEISPTELEPETRTNTYPAEEHRTSQDSVEERLKSEAVQAILEMGFTEDNVKQTVTRCLRDRPGNFPPVEELASMVMELEEHQDQPAAAAAATAASQLTPLQRVIAAGRIGSDVRGDMNLNQSGASPLDMSRRLEATQINGIRALNSASSDQRHMQNREGHVHADRIRNENSRMKDQLLCKICMENLVRVTFMPCGHLVCCGPCSLTMSECPICRSTITGCVRTYF